jgi:hypothetical protein
MKPLKAYPSAVLTLLFLVMALETAGCANPDARVVVLSSQAVVALDADDVVRVMRRAGFSDQQILDLGTDLRNALASAGAAQIRVGKKVEAILAVDEHCVYGTSCHRGAFVYDLEKRAFR